MATLRRMPKQLVRDIESACMARFGLRIDHKKVSIAQLAEEATAATSAAVCLQSLGLEYINGSLEVKAQVDLRGEICTGTARGADKPVFRLRVVAQAILSALESAQENKQFVLDEIRSEQIGRSQIVLASVVALSQEEEKQLVGMSILESSDTRAAAEAVLDAVDICFC